MRNKHAQVVFVPDSLLLFFVLEVDIFLFKAPASQVMSSLLVALDSGCRDSVYTVGMPKSKATIILDLIAFSGYRFFPLNDLCDVRRSSHNNQIFKIYVGYSKYIGVHVR